MNRKTKEQLLKELESLKKRLSKLEKVDIEQKKVIEALSESEAKYRLLFDAAPVGIGIADLEGKIIDANIHMQEMSGYSLDEYKVIGVESTYADPKERKLFLKSLREKGKVRDWEGRLKRKDGSEYHALLNADIMELGGRKVLLGIIRDITERNRIEIALKAALANAREEKNKSAAIISALGDGIIIQDTDYKITYQNQVQNKIYGDKTGELCYKAYEGRDQICEDCPVERTFRDGNIHRSERKITTDNGDFYFELTSSPLRDSNGKIIAGIKVVREITGQKRLEQTLRESEEKYRRLLETLNEGIWVLDKDAITTFVNPRMAQMLGYTVDEMLGKHLFSFMDEEWKKIATRNLKRRAQNIKEQHDFEFIRKDGTRIFTSLESSPIIDENGNYSGAVAAIADITERKRDETEKNRLLKAIASSTDGITICDEKDRYIYVNAAYARIFGYSPEDFIGETWRKITLSDMIPGVEKGLDKTLHNKDTGLFKGEVPGLRKDGRIVPTEVMATALWDENRNYNGHICIVRDITERKHAEEALREGEQFLENIFASIKDGIGIIDGDMNIIRVNKTAESWYPYATPLVGKKCYEAYHNRKERCEQCPAWETLKTGKSAYKVVPKHGPEGKEVGWLEIYSYPLNDTTTGRMKGVIEYVRDITERKLTEEELYKSKQLLERTFLSLSDAVFIIDSETTKIIDCNKAASKIFGYEKEEMVGRITAFLHVDEEALAEFRKKLYAAVEEKGFLYLPEFRMKRKNGEFFFTENTVTQLVDDIGKRLGWVSVVRDISELKRAQEALLKSEEKFRSIFEQSPIAIELYDSEGNLIDANRSCLALFGINNIKSVIGFKLFEDPNIAEDKKKRLSNGESIEFESVFDFELVKNASLYDTTKSGKCYLDILIVPLITEERERYGYLVHIRDITERKRMEEELKQSEEKYRLLIENIQEGVFVIQDAKMVFVNQAFAEIAGYSIEEIIGTDFYHFVAPEDLEMVKERYYRRQKGENIPNEYEFHAQRKNGEKPIVNMNVGIVTYLGRVASMGILEDITERKRAEKLIKQSEEKYRNLVELTTDIIYMTDKDRKHVFMNDAGYRILEALPEEVISHHWSECIYPDDIEKSFKKFREMMDKGIEIFEFENRYFSKSGKVINVLHNVRILKNDTGEIIGTQGIARDITERKRTEESLKLFSEAVESAPDGIQIVDTGGYIKYSNKAVEEIYGFSRDELIGKNVGELNADTEIADKIIQGIIEKGHWTGELIVRHKDGHEFPIWLTTSLVKDVTGVPIAMVGIIRDITERKTVEKALLESETRYRTLFESAGDAIFILEAEGEEGRIVAANRTAAKMHGYSIEELLAMKIDDLDTTESLRDSRDFISRILNGETIKAELDHRRKDGTIFPVEINAGLLELGGHKYILAFDRDITERKHTEEAIKKYNKELEESNRMKELFTDIMHHDLLNPLNVANGYVELFLDDETTPRKKSYLETIKRNLVKGMELIDNAMKFSKLESMDYIEFEDLDLKIVIGEAVANLTPLAVSAGMSIENKLKGSMPAKSNKIIEDIFTNLISNAIKHASKGKRIVVDGKDEGKFWLIRVVDFGAGIKDSNKKLIFERFHREEKKGVKGSGLGLAIVGKIVELHNGRVWVEDNPEGGAVFLVEIPKR